MNKFEIGWEKEGAKFIGVFRMAHWSRSRPVLDERGKVQIFGDAMRAHLAATAAFLKEINGSEAWWRDSTREELRAAAEAVFTRDQNGEGKNSGTEAGC